MDESQALLIEIPLGGGGTLTFRSMLELEAWIRSEEETFQFLSKATGQDRSLGDCWNKFAHFFQVVRQNIAHLKQPSTTETSIKGYVVQIESVAKEHYRWSGLGPTSPRRQFIVDLCKRNGLVAAYSLAFLIGKAPLNLTSREAFEGVLEAYLFSNNRLELGERIAADANAKVLDALRQEFSSTLDEFRREARSFKSEQETLVQVARDQAAGQAKEFGEVLEASKATLSEQVETGNEELRQIADAYDTKMAMQAPVTYWEEQRKRHLLVASSFGLAAFVWACTTVVLVYLSSEQLLTAATGEEAHVFGLPLPKVPMWHFALLVVGLIFAFWITRILVRVLLSQVHLHSSAAERVVMAKTYIALLREGQGPKDEDRLLILETLFRPSATGVVQDDGMPPFILEWLTRSRTK